MKRLPTRLAMLAGLILLVQTAPVAQAAPLTIDIGDVNLNPNGTGDFDVLISGDRDDVILAGYEFRITPDAGTLSLLRFLDADEAFLTAANYLFVGNSDAVDNGYDGAVSTVTLPDDTFIGGDIAADLFDVTVTSARLLVNLRVEHDAGFADPATTIGHSFTIDLVPISGDSTELGSNTFFEDSLLTPVAFTSSSGTVSIVPIPKTANLVFLLLLGVVAIRLNRVASKKWNGHFGW